MQASNQKKLEKSNKLANVCYDIRGPVLQRARQMEEEGQRIIKLIGTNGGNLAEAESSNQEWGNEQRSKARAPR